MLDLKPEVIVFGGGMFGVPEALSAWMPWLYKAKQNGAVIHFHNLGVGRLKDSASWLDAEALDVMQGLASFSVRDYLSVKHIAEINVGRLPRITYFPEADIPSDTSLADLLLPRDVPLLGISMIPSEQMRVCLSQDRDRVVEMLAEFENWQVVPIVSTVHLHSTFEDDMAGAMSFIKEFLPTHRIASPELFERDFWLKSLTPQTLKGLISRLGALITQRKHNAVHAIGCGVRVIGLHPLEDDSLRRTFVTMQHRLVEGSRCIGLYPVSWMPAS